MLYYKDLLVIPGEDKVFVLSSVWRALHAHQQSSGAKLVSVPVKYDRPNRQVMLFQSGGLADGFRVFAKTKDELEIHLEPHIEDAVQVKQVNEMEESSDSCIVVKRVYPKAVRERKKNGNNFIDQGSTLYLWYKKDEHAFPYHVSVSLTQDSCKFESKNTFGNGAVPVKIL